MSVVNHRSNKYAVFHSALESKFCFKDLRALNNPKLSFQLPLSVIAHIDLNAFFAQVEQIRLNLSLNDPIVCAQWSSLIAVSYAARSYGINRMDTIKVARAKCPDLIIAHAAVFQKGSSHWAYVPGLPDPDIHKVLLDPYRRESRKIFKVIKLFCKNVEKASVDEGYLDLGSIVYERLGDIFPEIADCEYQDDDELLSPLPDRSSSAIRAYGEIYYNNEILKLKKKDFPVRLHDWDDACILLGSQILFEIRWEIFKVLGFTTSGGVARNKVMAKLAGGFLKPDNQTVILNSNINNFLENFELDDMRSMGGKTGQLIIKSLGVPTDRKLNTISFIRNNFSLEDLKDKLSKDSVTAEKVYNLVRGNYSEELTFRTDVKSMMSRKNFTSRTYVTTLKDAIDWLKVFSGDLVNRIVELDDESMNLETGDSKVKKGFVRRPKLVAAQITTTSYAKYSKQSPIPVSKSLEKLQLMIEEEALKLLIDILDSYTYVSKLNEGQSLQELLKNETDPKSMNIVPLANISIGISNFVKYNELNFIDTYTGKGSASKSTASQLTENTDENLSAISASENIGKRTATDEDRKDYVKSLFEKFYEQNGNSPKRNPESLKVTKRSKQNDKSSGMKYNIMDRLKSMSAVRSSRTKDIMSVHENDLITNNYCNSCQQEIENVMEHKDYHYALKLSKQFAEVDGGEDLNSKFC